MNEWILLGLAIIFEVCGTTSLKLSQGFTKPLPSIGVAAFYILCFAVLGLAVKKIDISVAYAIWAGLGTALITLAGIFLLGEPLNTLKIASIFLIIAGVVGLNLSEAVH